MKDVILQLTWLDIVFILISLASFIGNIAQLIWYRRSMQPLKSGLIALFNDIKQKGLHAWQTQNMLMNPQNPHTDIQTLYWDYYAFTQTMMNHLLGFQETVVGLLVTVDPTDREGKETFRASNYGLTPEDKEFRRLFAAQQKAQMQQPATPQQQEQQPPQPATPIQVPSNENNEKKIG